MPQRIAILMPSFDEPRLRATLDELARAAEAFASLRVFLVDDGAPAPVDVAALPGPSERFSVRLARHVINLGQGAALETARCLALQDAPFDAYVTMDADGQHSVADLAPLVFAITSGADVALGDRFAGGSRIPRVRAAVLYAARLFESLLVGRPLGDAHNGLRAFSHRAIASLKIRQARMAHATEIVLAVCRSGHRVVEVPVTVHYTPESRRRGQSSLGALAIVADLLRRYLFGAGPASTTR